MCVICYLTCGADREIEWTVVQNMVKQKALRVLKQKRA